MACDRVGIVSAEKCPPPDDYHPSAPHGRFPTHFPAPPLPAGTPDQNESGSPAQTTNKIKAGFEMVLQNARSEL